MGFPKVKSTAILAGVFKAGNKIALLTAVNTSNDTYTKASGTGYQDYTIQDGDFVTQNGITTTARHILFGLAEGSWGTAVGIAVFAGSSLEYLGELKQAKAIGANTVPVFKMYNEAKGEGLKITLDVVTAASMNVTETS